MPCHERQIKDFRWRLVPSMLLIIIGLLVCAATVLHFFDVFIGAFLAGKLTSRDIAKLLTVYFLCVLCGACLIGAGHNTYIGKFVRASSLCFGIVPLLGLAYTAIVV